jgi:NAD-dependent dihydropyrimidine dehydrogenase PreA subunit
VAVYLKVSDEDCIGCGVCVEMCPTTPSVFEMDEVLSVVKHSEVCELCMLCIDNCPMSAITMSGSEDVFLDLGNI